MKRVSRVAALAGMVLGVGSLAACGSGGDASTTSTDAIKIMSIAPTGTSSVNFDTAKVLKGYFDKVNKAGGINGRTVELIACNDNFDPNGSANCARKAVRDKVVAVVGGFSGFEDQVFPILQQGKIPWVGNVGASAQGLKNPYAYPISSGPLGFGALGLEASKCTKTTPVILDNPAALSTLQFAGGAMKAFGKSFEKTIKVAQTTVDFAPIAKGLQGSDCALVTLPGPMYPPLVAAMQQLGVKSTILSTSSVLTKSVLAKWPTDQKAFLVGNYPAVDRPAWDEARATLPDMDLSDSVLQNTWIAAKVFQSVVTEMTGEVTNVTLKQALDTTSGVVTGGLLPQFNFTKHLSIPQLARITNPYVVYFMIKDHKLVQQGGFMNVAPPD